MNIEHDVKDELTEEELMDIQKDYLSQEMRDLFRNTCIDGSRPEEIDKSSIHCYYYCELDHKDLRQDLETVVRRVKLMSGRKAWGF